MISLQEETKIHIAAEPIDMRKAIDGLSALVVEVLEQDPQSGHVFVFRNKRSNKVKALYWDRNGFVMHYKRLEKGSFKFPTELTDGCFEVTQQQLSWLLAGLEFMLMSSFPELNYSNYY